MKHDKLFSTHVYLFDNVIDNNSLLQIRKDITSSYNQTTKNWQSKADLHKNKLYDKLTYKVVENTKKVFDSLYFEDYLLFFQANYYLFEIILIFV